LVLGLDLGLKPDLSITVPTNPVSAAPPTWLKSELPASQIQLTDPAPAAPQIHPSVMQFNPVLQPTIPAVGAFQQPVPVPAVGAFQPVPAPAPVQYQAPPAVAFSNPVLEQTLSVHNDLMRQMSDFERQQQEQFHRDLEEQRRILDAKQREYRVRIVLDWNKKTP
jgi:hypothetical protein